MREAWGVRIGFAALEAALLSQLPGVTSLAACVDVAAGDSSAFEGNGWAAGGAVAADYSYLVGGSRVARSDFRVKRFRDDPSLEYRDGLTVLELADLNAVVRIWDAGGVRWLKPVGVLLAGAPAHATDLDLAA